MLIIFILWVWGSRQYLLTDKNFVIVFIAICLVMALLFQVEGHLIQKLRK